ncbi:hypothetical protein FNV43_RR05263 [Rhamnella rubrinervis]|uniref:OVATE domain-containing protein n=1 Tax=Rhamnella rubrinervis TaxID=2594499 RepID=A0A8K0HNE2_9ROSA|nr:hypothetical protein FNV43_RR05263 [Rhamnella rubrinervis]
MKVKALHCFKSKLLKPCRKFFPTFKFKLKKPLFIRAFHPRHCQATQTKVRKPLKSRISVLLAALCCHRKPKEMDRLVELKSTFSDRGAPKEMDRLEKVKSFSDRGTDTVLFPSPITPAYAKPSGRAGKREEASGVDEDVEDACRSFENYLAEMIVEEGKVGDLTDVEELLHCWKSLKCPVFINLVCRFYGELCKDLFSADTGRVDSPN